VRNRQEQVLTTQHDEAQAREDTALGRVVDSLHDEFGNRQTREDPHQAVEDERRRWLTAPVRDFVPIFVERSVRSRLRA
jgi:hypothetical protein